MKNLVKLFFPLSIFQASYLLFIILSSISFKENDVIRLFKDEIEGDVNGVSDEESGFVDKFESHFKVDAEDRIIAKVEQLDEDSKINEIARLLSNEEITSDSIKQASNMMKS